MCIRDSIHIISHAEANSRNVDLSHIVFSEGDRGAESWEKLYVGELYSLRFLADLIILSACETGTGKEERGEGLLSLSRAFTYAGCDNVVSTLWKTKGQTTKEIMNSFHGNLKGEMSISKALGEAQRKFIQNRPGTLPFSWAGIISIGDVTAIY